MPTSKVTCNFIQIKLDLPDTKLSDQYSAKRASGILGSSPGSAIDNLHILIQINLILQISVLSSIK